MQSDHALRHFGVRTEYADEELEAQPATEEGAAEPPAAVPVHQLSYVYRPFESYTMEQVGWLARDAAVRYHPCAEVAAAFFAQAVADGVVLDPLLNYCAVSTRLQIAGVSGTQQAQQLGVSEGLLVDAASNSREVRLTATRRPTFAARVRRCPLPTLRCRRRCPLPTLRCRRRCQPSNGPPGHMANLCAQVVRRKAEYMARKLQQVLGGSRVPGARAMVVVRSRQHVVWLTRELRQMLGSIAAPGASWPPPQGAQVFGAFSGAVGEQQQRESKEAVEAPASPVEEGSGDEDADEISPPSASSSDASGKQEDEGDEEAVSAAPVLEAGPVTEDSLNPPGVHLSTADVIVVCGKLDTGYDDPRLTVMFIDRPLRGARAVQTLGRLTRPAPQLGKRSEDIHVFDFVNSVGSIRQVPFDHLRAYPLSGSPAVHTRMPILECGIDDSGPCHFLLQGLVCRVLQRNGALCRAERGPQEEAPGHGPSCCQDPRAPPGAPASRTPAAVSVVPIANSCTSGCSPSPGR